MGKAPSNSVLARKVAAGTEDHQARAMTLAKATRLTLAKVGDDLLDLPLAVISIVVEERTIDRCDEYLDDDMLLSLLDGPGGAVGLAIFDGSLVGGLIQQQTTGTVTPDRGGARRMTRTDAAMTAPLLDALFERAIPMLEQPSDRALFTGFGFGAMAEDARTARMALEEQDYVAIRMTLDLAKGTRQGDLKLILPRRNATAATPPDASEEDAPKTDNKVGMADIVMDLPAALQTSMVRFSLPLRDIQALSVGQILTLPPHKFPEVDLLSLDGRALGRATVGQLDGVRAVRPKALAGPAKQMKPIFSGDDQDGSGDGLKMEQLAQIDLAQLPEVSGSQADDEGAGADLPELPELMDLPDGPLDDSSLPDLSDLPDIDALPDLDDLPDLTQLPDLKVG